MKMNRTPFGKLADGKQVDCIRIENSHGYSIEVLTYGAYLRSLKGPDRNGNIAELTRQLPDLAAYQVPGAYQGATIGRYANRIAGASFTIDGKKYDLQCNSDGCQLHGGAGGFNTRIWEAFPILDNDRASVKLTIGSNDGDQGFPGNLDAALTITLTEMNELLFLYEAVTDKTTYISLTNHTYWNLRGSIDKENIYDQEISINADEIVGVNDKLLPTGFYKKVEGTPFDLRSQTPIGRNIRVPNGGLGFDNNYVLKKEQGPELVKAAVVYDPVTGRKMEVLTNAPGLQFYSDNFSDPAHASYCLEAGEFPDAMNHDGFPSPRLEPGEMYRQLTIHSFSIA